MTPIERACVAIIEALRAQGDLCDDCGEPEYAQVEGSFEVEPVARAVLRAIREPSEEMVRAAIGDAPPAGADAAKGRVDADLMVAEWQAMIDAALQSKQAKGDDK